MVLLLYGISDPSQMIESKAFDEMNTTFPIEPNAEPLSPDSPTNPDASASASSGILQRIKHKFVKRQVTLFTH